MRERLASPMRIVVAIVWLALLSGCSSLSKLVDPPTVSLTNVSLVQAGLLEQRYRLTLRIQNPNSIAIPVRGMDYAVKLAGVNFAQGVTPNGFRIPALGEDLVDIDVTTNLLSSALQIYTIFKQQPETIDYQLSGKIAVDMPGLRALPFNRSGTVNLTGLSQ